jgi:hypothetical protein
MSAVLRQSPTTFRGRYQSARKVAELSQNFCWIGLLGLLVLRGGPGIFGVAAVDRAEAAHQRCHLGADRKLAAAAGFLAPEVWRLCHTSSANVARCEENGDNHGRGIPAADVTCPNGIVRLCMETLADGPHQHRRHARAEQ